MTWGVTGIGCPPQVFLGSAWGLLPSALPASTTAGPETRVALLHGTTTEIHKHFLHAFLPFNLESISADIPATSGLQITFPCPSTPSHIHLSCRPCMCGEGRPSPICCANSKSHRSKRIYLRVSAGGTLPDGPCRPAGAFVCFGSALMIFLSLHGWHAPPLRRASDCPIARMP